VGVILIGHGQPLEWDEEFYTQTQQETSFRKDILKQLELDGYISKNLKLAWMEFRDPRPKDVVKHLVEEGATEIFYFSTIIGSESIHAKYDVPQLIHEIKVPNTVKLQQLTAFDDKSGIVKALIERIEDCK
jgi:sirohydrochlorin ferrochelatase